MMSLPIYTIKKARTGYLSLIRVMETKTITQLIITEHRNHQKIVAEQFFSCANDFDFRKP
jgi:hypothetical protein